MISPSQRWRLRHCLLVAVEIFKVGSEIEPVLPIRNASVIYPRGLGGQRTADQQDDRNDVMAHIDSPQEREVSASPG